MADAKPNATPSSPGTSSPSPSSSSAPHAARVAMKAPPVAALVIGPSALATQSGIELPTGLRLATTRAPRDASPASDPRPSHAHAAHAPDHPAARGLADDIFLSPRVVDERSFDEFATTLRGLVTQAQSQTIALSTSTSEVKALGDELRGASKELWTRVEAAAKVVPGIDQRVAKAEKILATVNQDLTARLEKYREIAAGSLDEASLSEKARTSSRAIIELLARTELEPRASAAAAALDAAAEAARTQIESMRAAAEHALQEREAEMIARIDRHAESRERATQALLEETLARIEAASAQHQQSIEQGTAALASLLERVAPAEQVALAAVDRIESVSESARQCHASLETETQSLTTRLGAAIAEAQRRSDSLEESLKTSLETHAQMAATLEARASSLDRAFEPIRQTSAIIERAEQAETLLSSLEARAAEHRAHAEKSLHATNAIAAQADQARLQLASSIIEGAHSIDTMEARITEAVAALQNHSGVTAAANLAETLDKAMQIGNALAQLSTRAEVLAQRLGR